ncbi:hypothetical protein D3C86_1529620 [compost metagenome]
MHQRESQAGQRLCDGLVALFDLPGWKQRLISRTSLRIGGKQHQPCGMSVDAMQWHQVRIVQAPDQAPEQRLFDVFASRRHRQKVRFVGHHQMLVRVQNRLDHRDRFFIRHFAKIMNPQTFPVGQIEGNRHALPIEDPATGDSVQPLFTTDGAEMLTQAIDNGLPRARWQVERTGLAVCRGKRRSGHTKALTSVQSGIIQQQGE